MLSIQGEVLLSRLQFSFKLLRMPFANRATRLDEFHIEQSKIIAEIVTLPKAEQALLWTQTTASNPMGWNLLMMAAVMELSAIPAMVAAINRLSVKAQQDIWSNINSSCYFERVPVKKNSIIGDELEALMNTPAFTFVDRSRLFKLFYKVCTNEDFTTVHRYKYLHLKNAIALLDEKNELERAIKLHLKSMWVSKDEKQCAVLDALNVIKKTGGDYTAKICEAVQDEHSALYIALNIKRHGEISPTKAKTLQHIKRLVDKILVEKPLLENYGFEPVITPSVEATNNKAVSEAKAVGQNNEPSIQIISHDQAKTPEKAVTNARQVDSIYPSLAENGIELTSVTNTVAGIESAVQDIPVVKEISLAIQNDVKEVASPVQTQFNAEYSVTSTGLLHAPSILLLDGSQLLTHERPLIDFSGVSYNLIDFSVPASVAVTVEESKDTVASDSQVKSDIEALVEIFGLFSAPLIEPGEQTKQQSQSTDKKKATEPFSEPSKKIPLPVNAEKFFGESRSSQPGGLPEKKKGEGSKEIKQKAAASTRQPTAC